MFHTLSIADTEALVESFAALRPGHIRFVDTHHCYKPSHAEYGALKRLQGTGWYVARYGDKAPGIVLQEAMDAYHRGLNPPWRCIGQHFSVDPDGGIITGRPLDMIPCSQTGFNTGAAMFEFIGNFCRPDEPGTVGPYDTLGGDQLAAGVALSAAFLACFKLPLKASRFHRDLHLPGRPSPKTCPGLSVDLAAYHAFVERRCVERWAYDPPGGEDFHMVAEANFDPAEEEGSGEPEPEAMVAMLDLPETGTATA